ncbi:TonB-dependent receptor [uncultured Azohydromonas sp.]|jgi:Outer membrane receptor proteins, mostly Fe transport|uniref:TonB-dependent receptor plug domain-containing protein n=1 Tax=uncultured Azohydromonas sp. TaxID=487342 RepID=UPI00263691FC|nr:TonB-dependent receptor [uncultured Azohydromonas sp.]
MTSLFPRSAVWLLALAAAAAGAQTAPAQPPEALRDLEALLGTEVEGASRQLESALDAAAVVSAITRAEAAALGHRTLAEMLERLPGIYLGSNRGYGTVGLRGFSRPGDYNARLLMSIDGYRVNDAVYDQALPDWEFPIVADWVKRLELVSGPASSVYGGNALLGVVNAVTLDGRDAPGLRLRAGLGSWNTRDAVLSHGWHAGAADLFIGLALHRSDGETLQDPALVGPAAPDGRVAGLDGTRYHSLFAKARLGGWRLTLGSKERVKDLATAPYDTPPGVPGTRFTDRYHFAELAWDGAWVDDWRAAVRMNLSRSTFDGRYVYDTLVPLINRDAVGGNWAGLDTRLQWRGWINHELTLGAEARRIYNARQQNFDEAPLVFYLDRHDTQKQGAVYAQDHWRLSERWSLTSGVRMDWVQGFDPAFSPRLALVMRPSEHEALKLLFGHGFRVPNLAERFYDDDGASQIPNPALRPERVQTVALAWERAVGTRSRVALHLYRDRFSELIDFVPVSDQASQYRNLSHVHSHGLDLEAQGLLGASVQWRTSVSLQKAKSAQGALGNSPRWIFKGHLLLPLPRPAWSAALQWQALGRRASNVPSLTTLDAVLRWQPRPDNTLALRVLNLFDARTWDPAAPDVALARFPRERRRIEIDWQQAF